uniref:B3 domain-containing protein At2g31420-like n=1 Tax=Erigeron canadensis TaxID=72917 RepID=UPI001CB9AD36|nr:B3 domain-containing protein At2g31420-like [Erigeron canadensis]
MAKNTRTSERKCRKNIATLLSLMGFKDDDPEATVKTMRAKLREIAERTNNNFKKPEYSPSRKIKLKCGGKTTMFSLRPKPQSSKTALVIVSNSNNVDHNMESRDLRNIDSPSCSEALIKDNVDHDDVRMELNDNGDNIAELGNSSNTINVCQEENYPRLPSRIKDLMNYFVTSIGGSRFKLVIQKKLTTSDVTKSQGRLLIPTANVYNCGMLKEFEKRKLGAGKDISVPVFDPKRREWTLNFTRWNMNKEVYVLKTGWNDIVNTNGLEEGMVIQVWSFRVNQEQLCFALVRV